MDDNLPAETPSSSPVPTVESNFGSESVVYHWQDVTEIFKKAADTLAPGVLVKESNFTLYEAMSAIEMMDAKMDSWMAGQKIKRKVLPFKESIKLNLLKLDGFTSSELILMMDHCFACILSWLEGQSLAQTVFTFAYLHDPSQIKSRPLKSFSYGVLKLCAVLMEKIDQARVFEEEDFQLIHFGFNLASELTSTRVLGMLRETEDDFARLIRGTKPKSSTDDVNHDVIELDGVLRRLKFLRFFLQALAQFGSKNADASHNISKIFKQMLDQLKAMKKTAPMDVTAARGDGNQGNHDGDDEVDGENKKLVALGFEPLLNQRLLPPTFPRYTKLLSIEESYKVYEEMISRMIAVCDVIPTTTTFHSLLNLIVEFSRSNPCVLTRSLVQTHPIPTKILFLNRCSAAVESMKDDVRRFNAPPCLRHNNIYNHPLVKQTIDNFLTEASMAMVKVFQVYGHNYARQRDKLGMLLENLSMVQDYGDRCDSDINQVIKQLYPETNINHLAYLGGWSLYHTLKIMIDYVTSGFVLDLYSKHELHYIYWYLCEVLLNWLMQTLNRANSQLQLDADQLTADQLAAESSNSCSGKKSSRNNNKKTKRNKNKKNTNSHAHELFKTQVWISLGWGTFKAIFGFRMKGEFQSPNFHLDKEEIRYEHRFQVFRNVSTPHYLSYKQYQAMTDVRQFNKGMTPEDMFLASSRHFDSARKHCESLPEMEEMDKLLLVAKKNLVVTKILSGPPSALTANKKISLDYSVHKTFPIIKMT